MPGERPIDKKLLLERPVDKKLLLRGFQGLMIEGLGVKKIGLEVKKECLGVKKEGLEAKKRTGG